MLKNGKEVPDYLDDYSLTSIQAYNVQQKINDIEEIGIENKSDALVNNGTIESSESKNGSATPSFSIGMFETLGSTTVNRQVRTRESLYETYNRMTKLGLVQKAIEVISDEASQKNDDNEVLVVDSNNEKIYNCLRELFFDKLSMNTELWSVIFETVKMGDNYYEISLEVKDGMASGIKRIKYIDPSKIEAHEKDGRIDYYIYRSKTQNNGRAESLEQKLFPWQIIHFKIENKETKPYGRSLLYSGIRSFERLTATEDIFLTYIISRTPNRRVFKIDVGGLSPLEAQRAVREIRDNYRSQQVIDQDGNLNQISSILSITSDIFIPTREGQSGTTIETLQGDAMNMNQNMNFLDNFKKDLVSSLNVPIEYLESNAQGTTEKSTTLSQKDIKFARFIERIQQQVVKGLYKIATLELFFNGFTGDDLKDFTIELTSPSTIKEASELGLLESKINLMQTMQNLNIFPTNWMFKRVLGLSDKEISEIQFMKTIEQQSQAQQPMGGGAGGGVPGAGFGEVPPTEGGEGEVPPEVPPVEGGEGEAPAAEAPAVGGAEAQAPGLETQEVSFINVNGQKFLLEDKQSFFSLMKYINEQKKYKSDKSSDFMNILNGKTKKKNSRTPNLYNLLDGYNEFGGLQINESAPSLRLYENDGRVRNIQVLLD